MTSIVYVPGAIVGYLLLRNGVFDSFDIGTSPGLTSATDTAFGWAADLLKDVAPDWMLFPVGLGVLLVGFSAFDRALPVMSGDRLGEHSDAWYTRKWPMFLVGCGVTLLTLSVAVSLTLLVPLVAKGILRRANTLPYIAGANITTLADTLVAAIVLGNQEGVQVVVAVTITVTIWTLLLLTFAYPQLRRFCLGFARWVLASHKRLGAFAAGLFIIPVVLIAHLTGRGTRWSASPDMPPPPSSGSSRWSATRRPIPDWLVGAREIRAVDDDWPQPGSVLPPPRRPDRSAHGGRLHEVPGGRCAHAPRARGAGPAPRRGGGPSSGWPRSPPSGRGSRSTRP